MKKKKKSFHTLNLYRRSADREKCIGSEVIERDSFRIKCITLERNVFNSGSASAIITALWVESKCVCVCVQRVLGKEAKLHDHILISLSRETCTYAYCVIDWLTQKNLDGALAHVVVTVESLAVQLPHLLAHESRVVVEELNEALQHVEMECRRNQLSVGSPFLT
jgi:hypothetical protein